MGFATDCIHAGQEPDPSTGAIITPIFQTSTYVQEGIGKHKGYEYARTHNPTRRALEKNLAALEGGTDAYCFASGMAATQAVLSLVKAGERVAVSDNVYGGTHRFFTKLLSRYGVAFTFLSIDPMKALFWSAVVNGVIAVPIMAVLMLLAVKPEVMGSFVITRRLRLLGWLATTVMTLVVVAMIATWKN